jgi:hypothetical protein
MGHGGGASSVAIAKSTAKAVAPVVVRVDEPRAAPKPTKPTKPTKPAAAAAPPGLGPPREAAAAPSTKAAKKVLLHHPTLTLPALDRPRTAIR